MINARDLTYKRITIYNYNDLPTPVRGKVIDPEPVTQPAFAQVIMANAGNTRFLQDGVTQVDVDFILHIKRHAAYPERQVDGGTLKASEVAFKFQGSNRRARVVHADNRAEHGFYKIAVKLLTL